MSAHPLSMFFREGGARYNHRAVFATPRNAAATELHVDVSTKTQLRGNMLSDAIAEGSPPALVPRVFAKLGEAWKAIV